ncbi:MAG: transcriptional regulator, LacI family [Rhizobacter sp.]|nr:transcriptional regulator, LacI family [Rhizobacter sp.]
MAVTLRDVARAAEVSIATASRALAGSRLINEVTQRHVVSVAASIGYRINTAARALKTRKSRLIGLTVHNLENASFRVLASVVQTRMQALGYQVILSISGDDAAQESEIFQTLVDHGVDGIIAVPTGANGAQLLTMEAAEIPVICAVRRVEGASLEAVLAADMDGAYAGTQHLLALGHRRIGLIVGMNESTSGKERLAGYTRAMQEAGLGVDPALVHRGRYVPETGVVGANALLSLAKPPSALFVANHESSVGVLRVVSERSIGIPTDLSLLFYEDSPWFEWQRPAISVVDSGAVDMANLAVDRLMQRIGGAANSGREYRIGSRLLERASCVPYKAAKAH